MADEYIFTMYRLRRTHPPDKVVLDNVSLSFFPGAKIGVLGGNGAGKSTLLRIMAGVDKDFPGDAPWPARAPGSASCRRSRRSTPTKDVLGNVEEAVAELVALLRRFDAINARLGEASSPTRWTRSCEEQARSRTRSRPPTAGTSTAASRSPWTPCGCRPATQDVTTLSGGERRRVALCQPAAAAPDLLLLDEPTNHLDAESVAWLERHLQEYPGTVVAVTHDRYFLDNVAGWILELDRGQGIPWQGNYSSWLEQKRSAWRRRRSRVGAPEDPRPRAGVGPHARRAPAWPRTRRASADYEQLVAEEGDRRERGGRDPDPARPRTWATWSSRPTASPRATATACSSRTCPSRLPPGGIVGVIGPNGAGKTTLFRMIVGQEKPDAGELRVGDTVELSYVDQSRDALDPDNTVFQEISGGLDLIPLGGKREGPLAGLRRVVQLPGPDQEKKVGHLSGGERNRVHLAKLLKSGGNLLLLDEPTNDLDVDTLRALEDALLDFAGCAVVISHDRWFLDRIATHILAFEGDSQVVWCDGNYQTTRSTGAGRSASRPTGPTGSPTGSCTTPT